VSPPGLFLLHALATFASGFVYDAACVMWVHFSESNRARETGAVAMLCALCSVVGIGEAVHDVRMAPFYILGFGAGASSAVRLKRLIGAKREK